MPIFSHVRKHLKRRARLKGLECAISADDLSRLYFASTACPICRVVYETGTNNESARSFDRINSSKGYALGNVAVICRKCNSIKSVYDSDGEAHFRQLHPTLAPLFLNWIRKQRDLYDVYV